MDFFKFIQSLDELLYEVMSWLLFYPLTLWRMIVAPLKTMAETQHELQADDDKAYDDRLPPPLFLLLSLILAHVAELVFVGQSVLVQSNVGLRGLINDNTSLIIFRILTFALLPVIAATRLVRARGARLNRRLLKEPFYAQCYAAAVAALLWGIGGLFAVRPDQTKLYAGLMAFAAIWLIVVETRWFAAELKCGLVRGFGQALLMLAQWFVILLAIGFALS